MKNLKCKTFVFFLILSITLFSCASKPKINEDTLPESSPDSLEQENDFTENDSNETEIDSEDNSENNSENDSTDETSDDENATIDKENNEDEDTEEIFEEPLTDEQNPPLSEVPDLIENDNEDTLPETETKILEPVEISKEEIQAEDKNENESVENTENANSSENIQNEKESALLNTEKDDSTEDDTLQNSENEDNSNDEAEESSETLAEDNTENENEEQENQKIVPSRSVTIAKNQDIDINYPGKGWIYQGNIDKEGNIDSRNRNFIFGGRKLGGKDTSFSLKSRNSGTYLLHFFKNDYLTGKYIDDYLEVIVQDKNAQTAEHITVPDYAEIVPPKVSITAEKKVSNTEGSKKTETESFKNNADKNNTVKENNSIKNEKTNISENTNSKTSTFNESNESQVEDVQSGTENEQASKELTQDEILEKAQKCYDEKDYVQAFSLITRFFDKATKRLDEGLFLQGRILEEKSSIQNIKDAIESYDLVVNNYPASPLWDKANKRSIFLKRFYINIR